MGQVKKWLIEKLKEEATLLSKMDFNGYGDLFKLVKSRILKKHNWDPYYSCSYSVCKVLLIIIFL